MTTRIIIAGILGGIVMFIWTSFAHVVLLPLGHTGVREMPNESAVVDALKTNLGDNKGLYVFPGTGLGPDASSEAKREAMKQAADKAANGPSGILMYHPRRAFNLARLLTVEFGTEVLEAILVVFLLSSTRLLTAGGRILFVTIAGVVAALATNVSYWNWYGFPKRYTVAYMFIQVVGFFLIGVMSAFALRNRDPVAESR
jgi:hypothetical protein